jgi:peptidoglycan/LPS O-acetylase OafA/YrhL
MSATSLSAPDAPEQRRGFRGDIEGLRAVAVLLVLVYHGNPVALPGGFVGVDVFFVISGFLISGLLMAEHRRTGTISLRAFYARRARRLLPATAVVLLAVVAGTLLLLPRTRFAAIGQDVTASALYGMNWLLAQRAVSYQALGDAASPLQHFWSLGVEEQFYLFWPVFILVVVALARWRRWHLRSGLAVAFTAAAGLSLLLSVYMASTEPERAYFVTPTRVWELALGGLLALFVTSERVRSRRWPYAGVVGWAGLGAIMVAAVRFDGSTVFPGWLALLPTVGAVLVIGAGSLRGPRGPEQMLALRPLQVLGGLSYSLYLWHWPMLVFARQQWPGLSGAQGLLISAASLLPAYLTYRWVERPVHTSPRIAARPRRGLMVGLACTMVGVLAGTGVQASLGSPSLPTLRPRMGAEALGTGTTSDNGGVPVDRVKSIVPDPVIAADDMPAAQNNGCQVGTYDSSAHSCTYGDRAGRTDVVLVGDSHATQLLPALELVAAARHWRVVTYLKGSCPLAAVTVRLRSLPFASCDTWNENVQEAIAAGRRPALVITTSSHYEVSNAQSLTAAAKKAALVKGLRASWARLAVAGIKVAVLADTPVPRLDIPECVAEHPDQLTRCAVARAKAVPADAPNLTAAAGDPAVAVVNLNDAICPAPLCAAVIGGVLVYRDDSHLTATYVKTLAPRLELALQPLVGGTAS